MPIVTSVSRSHLGMRLQPLLGKKIDDLFTDMHGIKALVRNRDLETQYPVSIRSLCSL